MRLAKSCPGQFLPIVLSRGPAHLCGLQASINVGVFKPCSGFFIKPPWQFCQPRVTTVLHSLTAVRALQQGRGKSWKCTVFPDTRLGGGAGITEDLPSSLPCERQPCAAPPSTSVSSHLPGLGCKKALPEPRLQKTNNSPGSLSPGWKPYFIAFLLLFLLRRQGKCQRSLKPLLFSYSLAQKAVNFHLPSALI